MASCMLKASLSSLIRGDVTPKKIGITGIEPFYKFTTVSDVSSVTVNIVSLHLYPFCILHQPANMIFHGTNVKAVIFWILIVSFVSFAANSASCWVPWHQHIICCFLCTCG
ncbi:hypothetical protein V6N13_079462 [Hibiscus sabdariffa]|uniref:Uncharacterized protein n=1 Tax=Hibiscus sabdariffa TaxID=183260 RepID=A0ABR2RRX2_9ROSI